MLCPKCGFISFDHLLACVKCQHDLSQIGAALHGTATDAECHHFLGLVLKEAAISAASQPQGAETAGPEAGLVEQGHEAAGAMETPSRDDFGEGDAAPPADESPALEFALDEIPHLDISDFEAAGADEEVPAEAEDLAPEEAVSLDLYLEEAAGQGEESSPQAAGPPPADQPAIDSASLEIDPASLTLTSAQAPLAGDRGQDEGPLPLHPQEPAEDRSSAPLTIDLNEIDLSDLVHDSGETSADSDGAVAPPAKEGLDFEDTMDLSLFLGDDYGTPVELPVPVTDYDGVEPIDLTLMDEALVELAVDPGRQEQSFQKEAPVSGLELSMEDKPK